jgi:excisionase family DNA binding protein
MMTPAELAAHLRVSERTIARMVTDGCPSILVGARRRFELAAVKEWAAQRAKECQSSNSRQVRGISLSASTVSALIADSRRVQLRVRPGNSKPNSDSPSSVVSLPSLATRD